MMGHAITGFSSNITGSFVQSRRHYDHAIALYDPAAHRPLASLFGQDFRTASLVVKSVALWCLGYPEAALADANLALSYARDMGDAGGLLLSLFFGAMTHFLCGSYATTETLANELYTLAANKALSFGSRPDSSIGDGFWRLPAEPRRQLSCSSRRSPHSFNGINRE
jgi:hypothetical protein